MEQSKKCEIVITSESAESSNGDSEVTELSDAMTESASALARVQPHVAPARRG